MLKKIVRIGALTGLLWTAVGGIATAQQGVGFYDTPEHIESTEFQDLFARVSDNVYMAGQPTELGLAGLADRGITTVINLRTSFEMDNRGVVPFDEAATLAELGLSYVHIPLGGPDTPYSAKALEQFAVALDAATVKEGGKVLLHCTVAWRASHLWTAYLVRYQGLTVAQAIAVTRQLNFGDIPVEGFLGQSLTFDLAPDY